MSHSSSDSIRIKRSDGKKHDLNTFINSSTDFQNFIIDQPVNKGVETSQKDAKKIEDECHDHKRPISIQRSDGLTHDIIHVYKAFSSPNPDTFKLVPTDSSNLRPLRQIDEVEAQTSQKQTNFNPTSVRIVHLSDTHNFLSAKSSYNSFLPVGDILVHSGNFTNQGTAQEYEQFDKWLQSVTYRYLYRVVVVGNCDVMEVGNNWDVVRSMLPHATHVLCHEEARILGIRFYGCPWHWGHEKNYRLRPGVPDSQRFNEIPDRVDVLITHGPAYGYLDSIIKINVSGPVGGRGQPLLKEEHWGSKELLDAIIKSRPIVHLHGHIRGSRGVVPGFGHAPLSVNSSVCDREMTLLYAAPHVIRGTLIYTGSTPGESSNGGSNAPSTNSPPPTPKAPVGKRLSKTQSLSFSFFKSPSASLSAATAAGGGGAVYKGDGGGGSGGGINVALPYSSFASTSTNNYNFPDPGSSPAKPGYMSNRSESSSPRRGAEKVWDFALDSLAG